MKIVRYIVGKIKNITLIPSRIIRNTALESAEAECNALEHLFTVLTAGTLVGIPALPLPITLELLPYIEKDLINLFNNIDTTDQPLSYLFSVFNVT